MFDRRKMKQGIVRGVVTVWLVIGAVAIVRGQDEVEKKQVKDVPPVLLQMMRNGSIHDHLGLDPPSRQAVGATLDMIDGPWWRSRLLGDRERQVEVAKLTETLRTALKANLSAMQMNRVVQLEAQALLTEEDQPRINKMSRQDVQAVYGQPYDFATIRRTFPRAPELVDGSSGDAPDGGKWLVGQRTTIGGLKGKVVAVHFYAFECINCIRNLPHYKSWHDDLADKGLVVIGIQTPETPRERDLVAVKNATKQSGIEYPVLMDPDAENWKAWGNTMWPTVYLVDKDGYIRAWWQGEMNWEGGSGEKTMRDQITKLLAE